LYFESFTTSVSSKIVKQIVFLSFTQSSVTSGYAHHKTHSYSPSSTQVTFHRLVSIELTLDWSILTIILTSCWLISAILTFYSSFHRTSGLSHFDTGCCKSLQERVRHFSQGHYYHSNTGVCTVSQRT